MPKTPGVPSLPFWRRGRPRSSSKLPRYQKLNSPTKERFTQDYSDCSGDDDESPYPPSSPASSDYEYSSTNGSRQSSISHSSSALMLRRKKPTIRQRVRRIYPYRLPNRPARCLALLIISSLIIMMITLIRASQVESMRIGRGDFRKKAPEAPHAWENFPLLTRYYGGIRTLVSKSENQPQYPKRKDTAASTEAQYEKRAMPSSKVFASEHPGSVFVTSPTDMQECFLDADNAIRVPPIRYYDGRPLGFPEHVLGSYEELSLPEDICFDRFGRYGPYGLGYSVRQGGVDRGDVGDVEGAEAVWENEAQVDFRKVDWADAQRRCFQSNAARFKTIEAPRSTHDGFFINEGSEVASGDEALRDGPSSETASNNAPDTTPETISRRALVLRCWDDMEWQADEILYVRSLISELSLATGGRYDVHLLVQVKDESANPIWADNAAYQKVIRDRIPREFRGMVTLWSTTQMLALYQGIYDLYTTGPDRPVHGAYRGLQMAMQHFAHIHPEYDYFWHWEMDIRYTGHYYDFFTKVENWAREQPRKGLWERSERFYIPSVHGTWEEFKQMAKFQSELTTANPADLRKGLPGLRTDPLEGSSPAQVIWGPERPRNQRDWFENQSDPTPGTSQAEDKYRWGVGEEADLISFSPIFDPEGTTWGLADDITGYDTTGGKPPRRAHISTASRMSRRLLTTMHRETAYKKHFAFPEMWPATVALHHGYKAVYAPHPSFVDREWPTELFGQVLNGGKAGASGGSRRSVFGQGEHNMHGLSWFYRSSLAPEMYKAWLGLKSKYTSGEEFELRADEGKDGSSVEKMRGGEGRMCLPPMLLHPIKNLGMVVEAPPDDQMSEPVSEPEFDPGS